MADIIVLGAGMVGISTALALQEQGHDVMVLDRSVPGTETSYGNAGIIQAEASEPYALPLNPYELLKLAFGWKNAVGIHWASLPRQATALLSYWRASAPASMSRVSPIWHALISEAISRHRTLIDASRSGNLISKSGYWEAYRGEAGLADAVAKAEGRRDRYGTDFALFDAAALGREEPGLKAGLAGAIHWTSPWTCHDPGGLVAAYARLFEERGGRIVVGDARALVQDRPRWRVAGYDAEQVVVALGPWSPNILIQLGYRVPMIEKRGYHLHYKGNHSLRRPMLLADDSVVLSPMLKGLRIATGAEFSAGSPPSTYPHQLLRGEAAARSLLHFGEAVEEVAWSGTRPCLPGMLPLVCRAPRHSGLWFHFGHGHQGFTLGPVTAARLARAIDGEPQAVANLDVGVR